MTTPSATMTKMFPVGAVLIAGLIAGCTADRPLRTPDVSETVRAELAASPARSPVDVPTKVSDALAEPVPKALPAPPEPRLDLLVNNAQAREVFLAIVADTRYSMGALVPLCESGAQHKHGC